ncbi:uncharacterized protein LOC118191812 isoform X2 [Stegodyphus dumicola]|nr:uncharacterized protein LOC118191812 isoform X2 [Stegodyphus dumicola]
MGRKEKRQRLIASIDPRFCGVVNSAQASEIESDPKNNSLFQQLPSTEASNIKSNKDEGFCLFLSKKLADYLDSHMKEVEPKPSNELLEKDVSEDFHLFSNSNIQVQGACNSVSVNSQPRKKKKKDK